jgi:hypothetical protein
MKNIKSNKIGFSFAMPVVVIGVAIILFAFAMISINPFLGIGFILAGGFMSTSSYGTQIDLENKKFREYGSAFGIKNGKWNSLDVLPFLSLMKSRSGYTVYSRTNRSSTDVDDFYEVCLLTQNHRKKIVVQKFSYKKDATEFLNKLSTTLNKPIVEFNPEISQKTKNRR